VSAAPEDAGTFVEVMAAAGQAAAELGATASVLDTVRGLVESHQPGDNSSGDVRDAAEELIRQLRSLLGRLGPHEAGP
jgi:hypothetical protein